MHMIFAFFVAHALTAGSPALTVPWGASGAEPSSFANGDRFCMLWAGRTQPMMNFSIYENADHRLPVLNMAAPWLSGEADMTPVPVRVEFSDGSVFEGRGVYGQDRHATVTRMISLDAVLDGLSKPGVLAVTIGNGGYRFTAPALEPALTAMRNCASALAPASP